ncbi:MAG: FAD-dependent oxidoreductase, partial [Nitrospirae bacterium]|nr:FAD-dependent oxidoreductase [Nitrospirota bacterium]
AMDSARTALRMGPQSVTVIYRRAKEDAPARKEELLHAEEEGVLFRFLANPVRFIGDESGWLKGVVCIEMEMGDPDESGKRRPVGKKGTEFTVETDTAVVAVGFGVNPTITQTTPDLETNRYGVVVVDPATGATSKKGVFAGGDVITGGSTVISAMGQAKIAAGAIDKYLMNGG